MKNNNNTKKDNFSQFAHYLRPLEDQLAELRRLNRMMPWSMRVPNSWFRGIDTSSNHVQSVEDLETFFVVPSTKLEEVVNYQIKLVRLTQPDVWFCRDFYQDLRYFKLDDTSNKSMFAKPGIYRVRINLVSFWNEKKILSYDEIRVLAMKRNIMLAGIAAVGAYALQSPKLYQSQDKDGKNLPKICIAEINHAIPYHDDVINNYMICSGWNISRDWDITKKRVSFGKINTHCLPDHACPSFVRI